MGNCWRNLSMISQAYGVQGPDPCTPYLGTERKRTHHMQFPAHRGLSRPYLSLPRTFPSGREPSLLILFHMARHLTPVYDWPYASRRISQKRDSEIHLSLSEPPMHQEIRWRKTKWGTGYPGQPMLIQVKEVNTNYPVNEALKQGWSVRSRIIRPVFLLSVRECNWQRVEVRR